MAFFEFENRKVYYNISGQGRPVLLLHGNTVSSELFSPVMGAYSREFKVIEIDFPGHGKSDRLEKFEMDFWYCNSKVCHALIKELKLEELSVVGTSGGALVAINLALEHPESIRYLVADSFEGEYPLSSYITSLKADRERDKKNPPAQEFWFNNHGPDWENIVDLDTEMLIEFSTTGKSFFHKSISELKVPCLLTGSMKDEFCDHLDEIYRALKRKNPSLEIYLFEHGNHPAMLSNHDKFLALVREKINTV